MAGLLDIFGTGGTGALSLLGGGDIQTARDDAQAQALYALAGRLFQGGNTGASIAQGLQAGQQAYKNAMQSELQDRLQTYQLQEYAKKKQEEEAAKKREALAQQLMMKAYQPAQQAVYADTPLLDVTGQEVAGPNMPQSARPAGYNKDVVNQMLAFKEGQAALGNVAKIMPELRKAGMYGQQTGENPFTVLANDPTVPQIYRGLASRYAQSYSQGLIDEDTADKRMKELSDATQRAAQFQQSQAGIQAQRDVANMFAQQRFDEKQGKLDEAKKEKAIAKDQLSSTIMSLKDNYDTLKKEGAITSVDASPAENLQAKFATSAIGKFGASAIGTKAATARDQIEQTRPLLLNLIKTATGMSAQQMNSNAEMNMYLRAATDPNLSYEANMAALKNLDNMFGLGLMKDDKKESNKPTVRGW